MGGRGGGGGEEAGPSSFDTGKIGELQNRGDWNSSDELAIPDTLEGVGSCLERMQAQQPARKGLRAVIAADLRERRFTLYKYKISTGDLTERV
jgi:hypothetical protein